MSDIGYVRDSTGSGRKKIFAVVSPPMPAYFGRKTIRRILIFDNHPDSLRLVSESDINSDVYLAGPQHTSRPYSVLGLVLIMTLVLAMLWLLG
jgi:hypothetical protein